MCCYQPQNKYLRMNKNQELVEKFLAGNLEGTRTFERFTSEYKEEIKRAEDERDECKEYLERFFQGHQGMVDIHSRPEEVFLTRKRCLQESLEWSKQSYTQVCSIGIESGVLRCQVPIKDKICQNIAAIAVPGRTLFFTEKSFAIPEEFMGKDPLKCEAFADWVIQTIIVQGNIFVRIVLEDELNS